MRGELIPIKTALISVADQMGLESFAKEMRKVIPELEIISSGGTAKALAAAGISVTPTEAYTGFPESFGGRVKTLHPKVMGGILYRRGVDDAEARKAGVKPIDLIVCNLYDFAKAAEDKEAGIGPADRMDGHRRVSPYPERQQKLYAHSRVRRP